MNQINSLKENINKTDNKISTIEREYRNIGGIKPEFVSNISLSELNKNVNISDDEDEIESFG